MRAVTGKEFSRLLERDGWELLRVHGGHHVYGKPGRRERVLIPVHGNTPLKRGLLRHLIKTAGLDESDAG